MDFDTKIYHGPSPYTEIYKARIGKEVFVGTSATEDTEGNRQGCNDFMIKMIETAKLYRDNKELIEALAANETGVSVEIVDFAKSMTEAHTKFYHHAKEATIPYNPLRHVIEALSAKEKE